ncbi:hypothetical protein THAOC_17711 [Thalassiosira oceanica]|uniref:Uncharacterized protein n=1 Tax=Thalassiosira oceanica TaxID=159749 RepID=K0SLD9_THAOC|nr:hypothetical protein THAOC_17711 [Thalassiosira oceanica]|eukprot:EJK61746.1 hypothetical protein THAOC_17711 [Thalassiosira oceanica]
MGPKRSIARIFFHAVPLVSVPLCSAFSQPKPSHASQESPGIADHSHQNIDLPASFHAAQLTRRKKRRKQTSVTKWIACSSTTEVARAIDKYINEGDTVAELGSQLRDSSMALCQAVGATGKALLVDVERKFPNEKKGQERTSAMRREGDEVDFFPDRAEFVETSSFQLWREALFLREYPKPQYDALVVDMSTVAGNDLDLTCISLVREFIALNRGEEDNICRAVIVKSGSLQNLARRLHHAQRIITGAQTLEEGKVGCHSSIIGAVGVKQYRETIPFVVKEGDVCIEVGSHLGTTTTEIDKAANGGSMGESRGDGFRTGELARMKTKHFGNRACATTNATYDVVYVDIGGLSGSEGLLEAVSLMASISNSLEPRCIVIKSLCIRQLSSCLIPFSEVWQKDRSNA